MRLVLIDRRRESLHVELSLCEGPARTDRGIQRNDDYEQDEKNESCKLPNNTLTNPDFCRGASASSPPTEVPFPRGGHQ